MARRPEPDDLFAGLEDALDPRSAAALYNPEVLGAQFGTPTHIRDAMGDEYYAAIPLEGRQGYAEAVAFANNDAFEDYNPDDQDVERYRNLAADPIHAEGYFGQFRTPAELSEVPTATSKPERPRTVAAGYDPERAILTLVFRDGTYYNYYEVMPNEWTAFRNLPSKWRYIRDVLDKKPRGLAGVGMDDVSQEVRIAIYQVARTGQVRRGGKMAPGINRGAHLPLVPQAAKRAAGKAGKNPAANRGKAPRKRA